MKFDFETKTLYKLRKAILWIIIIIGSALRWYVAYDRYPHCWDERYHALVAKHLLKHPFRPTLYEYSLLPYSISNWTANHIWLHKQPLSLWAIAGSLKLFGYTAFAVRIPSLVLSAFAVYLCYDLGKRTFSARVGLLTAFFFSLSGISLDLVSGRMATDHPDVFLSFFVLLSIYSGFRASESKGSSEYYWLFLTGLSLGAGLLSKWLPALVVLPTVLVLYQNQKRHKRQIVMSIILPALLSCIIFLPWQLYINRHFPLEAAYERKYNYLHFFQALEGQGAPWYYFINRIRIDYGELVYLPLGWACYSYVKNRQSTECALLVWIGIPLLIFSFAATKMPAYMFLSAPAFFLLTALFIEKLIAKEILPNRKLLRQLMVAAFLFIPIRYCAERAKFFRNQDRNPQWVTDIIDWGGTISGDTAHYVLLGYKAPIEAMFYTNCTAYDFIPELREIRALQSKGYKPVIAGALPEADSLSGFLRYPGQLPPY
jgi:4-amino-4-deoxy-L-arabinose transferase